MITSGTRPTDFPGSSGPDERREQQAVAARDP